MNRDREKSGKRKRKFNRIKNIRGRWQGKFKKVRDKKSKKKKFNEFREKRDILGGRGSKRLKGKGVDERKNSTGEKREEI